eukprot:10068.XXX_595482_595631_1 [CDS] Oithona nana genome sequencing.
MCPSQFLNKSQPSPSFIAASSILESFRWLCFGTIFRLVEFKGRYGFCIV